MNMENETVFSEANWPRWNHVELEPKFRPLWFETVDIDFWYNFSEAYMTRLVILAVILYHGSVWSLKRYMKNQRPFDLRLVLFFWNTLVGVFSIFALLRLSAEVSSLLIHEQQGFYKSICLRTGLHMSTCFWTVCVFYTKPILMMDTIFLVLRKKNIGTFHLVHHTLAMAIAPAVGLFAEPLLRWIGLANLFVHSIDYPLLALQSVKFPVPKSKQIMTALEIVQMLFVLTVSTYTLIMRAFGVYCIRHSTSILITNAVFMGLLGLVVLSVVPEHWKSTSNVKDSQPKNLNNVH